MVVPSSVRALSPAPRFTSMVLPVIVALLSSVVPSSAASTTVSLPEPETRMKLSAAASVPASATWLAPSPSAIVMVPAVRSSAFVTV